MRRTFTFSSVSQGFQAPSPPYQVSLPISHSISTGPVTVGRLQNGSFQQRTVLCLHGFLFGVRRMGSEGHGFSRGLNNALNSVSAVSAAQPGKARVPQSASARSRTWLVLQIDEMLIGAHISVLHHVLALAVLAQNGSCNAVKFLVMAAHQQFKGRRVAAENARHHLFIARRWALGNCRQGGCAHKSFKHVER